MLVIVLCQHTCFFVLQDREWTDERTQKKIAKGEKSLTLADEEKLLDAAIAEARAEREALTRECPEPVLPGDAPVRPKARRPKAKAASEAKAASDAKIRAGSTTSYRDLLAESITVTIGGKKVPTLDL